MDTPEFYSISRWSGFASETCDIPKRFIQLRYLESNLTQLVTDKKICESLEDLPLLDAKGTQKAESSPGRSPESSLNVEELNNLPEMEIQRMYSVLSILSNVYIREKGYGPLPPILEKALMIATRRVGIVPILTHASVDLYNWKLINHPHNGKIENIKSRLLITGNPGEERFYLVMVNIEIIGSRVLSAVLDFFDKSIENVDAALLRSKYFALLKILHNVLIEIRPQLDLTYELLHPDFFFDVLRTYLSWSVPVPIEGDVKNYDGGSAAQSSLIQTFDIILGVDHTGKEEEYVKKIRGYMPEKHRKFLEDLQKVMESVRPKLEDMNGTEKEIYDSCVVELVDFRKGHLKLFLDYVKKPAEVRVASDGTGGTKPDVFLGNMLSDTKRRLKK